MASCEIFCCDAPVLLMAHGLQSTGLHVAVRAHRGAGRPLREEHPETCRHLSPFPSGPADIVKHHQGQRGEYGSHSILSQVQGPLT